MAIWIDVTTSLNWNRPPVGIVRTELECARYALAARFSQATKLCYFDKSAGEFRELSKRQAKKINNLISGLYEVKQSSLTREAYTVSSAAQGKKGPRRWAEFASRIKYSLDSVENGLIRGWAAKAGNPRDKIEIVFTQDENIVARTMASQYRDDLARAGIGGGNCAFTMPLADLVGSADPEKTQRLDVIARSGRFGRRRLGTIAFDKGAFRFLTESQDAGPIVTFSREDVYVSAGLDWDNKDFNRIYNLKLMREFRVVGFCYDLIPFFFPHLCVGDVSSFFSRYFTELSWCADGVVCISECSRRDYKEFVRRSGCALPETKVVRLGSAIARSSANGLTASPVAEVIAASKYILFVSTIERRKNHEVLYKAYVKLVERGIADLPKLVFVGMRGWGVSDLFSDITLDPRIKDHIVVLNDIDDKELSALYENCLFTVFPSLYEGWGLPVAESLGHGKYCLASGAGSIPEIAGDLLDYLDPWDVQAWANGIEALLEKEYLESKEHAIRERYQVDEWSACVDGIFEFADKCGVRQVRASA
ncbi:glycosyltransferase family 4 protein [Ensifer canadensis]